MAAGLYTKGKEGLLDGSIVWNTGNIRAVLVSTAYTPNLSTHQYLSSVTSAARLATISGYLPNRTGTGGVAGCDPFTFPTVVNTGSNANAVVVYADTGDETTSRLLGYFDNLTGLPFTPNGGSATVTLSSGLFSL
jgi:hypothetical protein